MDYRREIAKIMLKNINCIEETIPEILKYVLMYSQAKKRTIGESIEDLKLLYQQPLLMDEYKRWMRKQKINRLLDGLD